MKAIEKQYIIPFCLVSVLFLLWGLANNMTDTLLAAFKRIMSMSDTQTSFIQFAFYGSYFCFALPAALFIRKYSFKAGIVLGLLLYAGGTMLFYPASVAASYTFYLFAIYIMAGGCAVLETTANPYIMAMGSPETATRRLNIAQSLNPIGSITGILMSQFFILDQLNSASATDRMNMNANQLAHMQAHELSAVTGTYMSLGIILLFIMVGMFMARMPEGSDSKEGTVVGSFKRLAMNNRYLFGVVAQFFYLGAQIGVWSFTIRLVMQELDMREADASTVYLISIIGFCLARFIFTWLMKYFRPAMLMAVAAACDIILSIIVVTCGGTGWFVVVSLVLISFFMSLQFPTIYGIALEGVGEDSKIGASGLIMAILGGAVWTPIQGMISDATGNINYSYVVPILCFVVVFAYSVYALKTKKTTDE